MPAAPKSSKPSHVLVWNRGRVDSNGQYRVGNIILSHIEIGADARPISVIHPITVGLALVPRDKWQRALADATAGGSDHLISKAIASGRLAEVDLAKLDLDHAKEALDQTASKDLLKKISEGKYPAPAAVQEHVVDLIASWHRKTVSKVRKVTAHFASYSRAS